MEDKAWYFDPKKPYDTKIVIYMIAEDVVSFLNGNYNVQWSTQRSQLTNVYNEVVQLHIHPLDYHKLLEREKRSENPTYVQLEIPFSYE
jgi:hypothetical protein